MSSTEAFIKALGSLKNGDLGLLRTHAGQGLDESVDGFDLFAGLWWPLRQKNQWAPRREVAWLIAKLYAFCPVEHSPGQTFARQLGFCLPDKPEYQKSYGERFDKLLSLPLDKIEPALQWALRELASNNKKVDWVKLTDDLSRWENETIRLRWAEEFLGSERKLLC